MKLYSNFFVVLCFLLDETPKEFWDQVSHVTMGKWLGLGLVLVKVELHSTYRGRTDFNSSSRNNSTTIECKDAMLKWKMQITKRKSITSRMQKTIEHFDLHEDIIWGQGIIIFGLFSCNVHRPGLKNRLLPMLEETSFSSKANLCFSITPNKTKKSFNDEIVTIMKKWLVPPKYDNMPSYGFYYAAKFFLDDDFNDGYTNEEFKDYMESELNSNKNVDTLMKKIKSNDSTKKVTIGYYINDALTRAISLNLIKKNRKRDESGELKRKTIWNVCPMLAQDF